MSFPTIPTVGAGRVLTAVQADANATRTFPSLSGLTKNAGDLLIAIVVCYQSSLTSAIFSGWGASFTEFHDSGGSSQMCVGIAYKRSDGTETGTFSVTQGGTITGHAALILLSIPGVHSVTAPEAGSRATGTTSAADPASFDPAGWAAEDTLWIALAGCGETSTSGTFTALASAPANFGDYAETGISADAVGGVEAAVAFRQLNASAQDVGTFSLDTSNARNVAVVIALRPAPEAIPDAISIPVTVPSPSSAAESTAGAVSVPAAVPDPSSEAASTAGAVSVSVSVQDPTGEEAAGGDESTADAVSVSVSIPDPTTAAASDAGAVAVAATVPSPSSAAASTAGAVAVPATVPSPTTAAASTAGAVAVPVTVPSPTTAAESTAGAVTVPVSIPSPASSAESTAGAVGIGVTVPNPTGEEDAGDEATADAVAIPVVVPAPSTEAASVAGTVSVSVTIPAPLGQEGSGDFADAGVVTIGVVVPEPSGFTETHWRGGVIGRGRPRPQVQIRSRGLS